MKVTQPKLKMLALDLYVSDGSTAWRPAGATRYAARLLEESNEGDRFLRNIDVRVFSQLRKDESIML